jgi:hypothetical protein
MQRVQWERNFFVCFPELAKIAASSTTPRSVSTELLPPGRAVYPGCECSSFERVVKSTRSSLVCSYNRTDTAARFETGRSTSLAAQIRNAQSNLNDDVEEINDTGVPARSYI